MTDQVGELEPMRLLLLISSTHPDGAQKQAFELLLYCRRQLGWQTTLVAIYPSQEGQPYLQKLASAGVHVHILLEAGEKNPFQLYFRTRRLLRRYNPHVFQSFLFHANILARLLRLTTQIPVIVNSIRNVRDGGRLRDWMYRLTDVLVDLNVQNSQAGANRYIELHLSAPNKMMVINNSINSDRFMQDTTTREAIRKELGLGHEFVWLNVGRLSPAKNHAMLVQAFDQVHRTYPNSKLLIVGRGELHDDLQYLIHTLGLGQSVVLLGTRRDMPRLYNAADAFVLASLWEGTPNVLLEAAATSLPSVATPVGDNHVVIQDKLGGYILPDITRDALAHHMIRMMHLNDAERSTMGKAARSHIQKQYAPNIVHESWVELYRTLL